MRRRLSRVKSLSSVFLFLFLFFEGNHLGLKYNVPVSTPDDKNKILYYYLEPDPKGYSDIKSILEGFEKLYAQVATIGDHSVENVKKNHPDWQAGRYTPAKFDKRFGECDGV